MVLVPLPASYINWDKLSLTVNDTVNGHVECRYDATTGEWTEPEFINDPYIRIHGLSPALNYGMQAYEGLKACRSSLGAIHIFRPLFHASRLAKSAACVSMPAPPEKLFIDCVNKAVALNAEFVPPHNSSGILYIRPVLFATGPQLALQPSSSFTFAVYVHPASAYHGVQPLNCLVMEDFDRAAPKGTGFAKVGGNYAPVIRWSRAAAVKGYSMTLHLDSATRSEIEEFSTSGFIGVKKTKSDKVTIVVPDSNSVIDSVTSNSCITLAESLGWIVERRRIPWAEISEFHEVLAVGTAASVVPIKSILRESTGESFSYTNDTQPGPVAQKLTQYLNDVMRHNVPDNFDWLHEVNGFKERQETADYQAISHTAAWSWISGSITSWRNSWVQSAYMYYCRK
jgi:branched-chain amino acid aminotransferase